MEKAAQVVTERLSLSELYEYPINPNKQDARTFDALVADIKADGYTEPMDVVPRQVVEPGQYGFTVISGNHRLKALRHLGYTEADCVVHHDWDAETCKIKVVRRNMVRGDVDTKNFTKLVDSILNPFTPDQLVDAMGLRDITQFERMYQSQLVPDIVEHDDIDPAKLYEGLNKILNRLFAEYGDTIPYSFMFFLFGSKAHLAVNMNTRLKKLIQEATTEAYKGKADLAVLLTGLIRAGAEATKWDIAELLRLGHPGAVRDTRFEPVVGPPDIDFDAMEDEDDAA